MTIITQENLDKHQVAVRNSIKSLNAAAWAAGAAADELCQPGMQDASREVGLIGAELRAAVAHAERAYRMARTLNIPMPDGTVAPMFGDK